MTKGGSDVLCERWCTHIEGGNEEISNKVVSNHNQINKTTMDRITSQVPEHLRSSFRMDQILCCHDATCPNLFTAFTFVVTDILSAFPALYNFARLSPKLGCYDPHYSLSRAADGQFVIQFNITTETRAQSEEFIEKEFPKLISFLTTEALPVKQITKRCSIGLFPANDFSQMMLKLAHHDDNAPLKRTDVLQAFTTLIYSALLKDINFLNDFGFLVKHDGYAVIKPRRSNEEKIMKIQLQFADIIRQVPPTSAVEGIAGKSIMHMN